MVYIEQKGVWLTEEGGLTSGSQTFPACGSLDLLAIGCSSPNTIIGGGMEKGEPWPEYYFCNAPGWVWQHPGVLRCTVWEVLTLTELQGSG